MMKEPDYDDYVCPIQALMVRMLIVVSLEGNDPCGKQLNAREAGYITSPGYPHDYTPHQRCEWVVRAPENHQKILLNFNPHFELEKHDCR